MNQFARYSLAAVLLFAADRAQLINAQDAKQRKGPTEGVTSGEIERGRYIVESVAMCGRCHTPRNEAGEPELNNKLMGAPIQQSVPGWATAAPRIAGRPPGTDEEFIRLLTTGISRTGRPPRPPMPGFRMTKQDAEAVLAYLKSLRR